jgi:hypothetical protein
MSSNVIVIFILWEQWVRVAFCDIAVLYFFWYLFVLSIIENIRLIILTVSV